MTLLKTSKRALRVACCGRAESVPTWYASDTETGETEIRVELKSGEYVRHECAGGESKAVLDYKPETEVPAPSRESDPRLKVLNDLFGVDPKVVEEIVDRRLAESDRPTRTVVVREGVKREVKGLTHAALATVIATTAVDHVMLVGPAGTGKSTIARQTAEALSLAYYSMSMGPQTSQTAFVGYRDGNGTYHGTVARRAIETGGVLCLDEMDNAHPSVVTMLNAILSGDPVAFPDGEMITPHADLRVIGTANTYGLGANRKYVGRQALDAAFLDRFAQIDVPIDEAMETSLATGTGCAEAPRVLELVRKVRKNAEAANIEVVVSPRASLKMCELIASGVSFSAAVDMRLRRGMDNATWTRVSK